METKKLFKTKSSGWCNGVALLLMIIACFAFCNSAYANSFTPGTDLYFYDNGSKVGSGKNVYLYYWYDGGDNWANFTSLGNKLYKVSCSGWNINGMIIVVGTQSGWSYKSWQSGDITSGVNNESNRCYHSSDGGMGIAPFYALTISDNGTTTYGGSGTSSSPYHIKAGTTIEVKVGSSSVDGSVGKNYNFYQGSTSKQSSTGTTYSFTGVTAGNTYDFSIEAKAEYGGKYSAGLTSSKIYYKADAYTATATVGSGAGGTVTIDTETASSSSVSKTVVSGTAVDFKATPSSGYNFKEWNTKSDGTGTRKSTNATYNVTITAATTLYAIFEAAGCEKAVPVAVYGSTFNRTNFKPKFKVTSLGTCGIKEAGVKLYTNQSCTGDPVAFAKHDTPSSIVANKEYTLNVTGLTNNSKYYCKAYIVTNDDETVLSSNTVEQATRLYVAANGSTSKSCNEQTLKANVYKGGANVTSVSDIEFNVYSDAACNTLVGTFDGSAITNLNTSTATTATATGLTPNTQYWFRITATASTTLNGSSVDVSDTSNESSGDKYTFTTAAASITPSQSPITFATHVILGLEGDRKQVTYTFCGHTFTASDFALTGTNATDFAIDQQYVGSGTASVKIKFTPKSGIGAKSANLVVKEGGNVISTIPVSATADCITPTKANYSVSGNVHTYDGSPKTAIITPNTGSTYGDFITGTATYGGQPSQTNVDNYTIHYIVPAGGNYCATNFDFDEKLTISKATLPDITDLPSGATKCADETLQLSPVCAGATLWEYSSSNTSIATVSNDGLITFEGAGNATITVTAKAPNYYNKTKNVSVTTIAGPVVSASAINTTAYEVITLTSTSGSVLLWSKDAADTRAYFVKNQMAVDGNTVEAESVNFKAPAKVSAYTITAKNKNNDCTSNLSIKIDEPHETCN